MKFFSSKHIGNLLILTSLLGFFSLYFPVLQLYLFPQTLPTIQSTTGWTISIPTINATAPLIPEINPWNEKEYLYALEKGVAHAKGTALPGEKRFSFIFAHSSGYPWQVTRYNTVFWRLGELNNNDEIIFMHNQKKFTYVVFDKKTVSPAEVEYITKEKRDILIVQTCTPVGTSLFRLLVFAKPKK